MKKNENLEIRTFEEAIREISPDFVVFVDETIHSGPYNNQLKQMRESSNETLNRLGIGYVKLPSKVLDHNTVSDSFYLPDDMKGGLLVYRRPNLDYPSTVEKIPDLVRIMNSEGNGLIMIADYEANAYYMRTESKITDPIKDKLVKCDKKAGESQLSS